MTVKPLTVRYGDDPEMDEWMEMSDEQMGAILDAKMREYNEWWDSLTRLQQYRIMRRRSLESIERKKHLRQLAPAIADILAKQFGDPRISMLRAREFLRTGVYPASDR